MSQATARRSPDQRSGQVNLESPKRLVAHDRAEGNLMEEKLLYRVGEVAAYLSVSRSKLYELVRTGRLPSVKIDGIRRIRGRDVMEFVDSHTTAA